VCFDAKECATDTFPLQNIHEHQIMFMKDFEQQGGISFLLIYFSKYEKCYYLRFEKMMEFWNRQYEGKGKHFKFREMEEEFEIPIKNATFVHYLETIKQDLLVRKEKS
jgi:recombination protein U